MLQRGQSRVKRHTHLQPDALLPTHTAHLLFSFGSTASDNSQPLFPCSWLSPLAILDLLLLTFSFYAGLTLLCSWAYSLLG